MIVHQQRRRLSRPTNIQTVGRNTTVLLLLLVSAGSNLLQATSAIAQVAPNQVAGNQRQIKNQAAYVYETEQQTGYTSEPPSYVGLTGEISTTFESELIDPLGRIVGCRGEILDNYAGFNIAIYNADPSDPTGAGIGSLVSLTTTELPDIQGNGISAGLAPNSTNANPYFLAERGDGVYNFLLDPAKGQLDVGRAYILVINPPSQSIYSQRRIRIVINSRNGGLVTYTASSVDGRPISGDSIEESVTGSVQVNDAATTKLTLTALDLQSSICQAQEIQVVKSADRAVAAPGDTVVYRLSVRNLSSAAVNNLLLSDQFPNGFQFQPNSVKAEFQGQSIPVSVQQQGRSVLIGLPGSNLPAASIDQTPTLNVAYAATLTPDAMRGSGRNIAVVSARRTDNGQAIQDGPSAHQLLVRPGVIADCGTILGRVFVDKNFDGEQQRGEPGIPNAVVFLEDGNRITTDENGLFSVANVLPGYRSGVLDLSSIPGYTLAPNQKFKERNSQSRLIHLAPSGLARMNFAVTPVAQNATSRGAK
ncbi:DUF11 domain-containing protein [filamentous cyanobacterium LEGE 11480]|uniref:DUF11 domain-containing protein n=1 Tax=Romeriopsis navalis LEGE 11480 TaxID=2777977 RepID=A0A928VKN2_9CYAN|nr:hypothetical protein [Romeriopsis navalis]MBE9030090.1 DUF11 domain-containing protein [Romeriopsis navalis LEGE 11480]